MFAQPKTPEEARRLGLPEWQIKTMFPEQKGGGMIGAILNGGWDAGAQYDDPPGGLLATESKPKGFWQGGDKFTGKDALAGLLAAVGDGLMMNAGGEGAAVGMLAGGRTKARDKAEKQAAQQAEMAKIMQIAQANGISPEQAMAQIYGLDLPKPEKPPTWLTEAQTYDSLPAEVKAQVGRYFDVTRPYSATTPEGPAFVPRATIMGGGPKPVDESEWERAKPIGGPASPAPGAFPFRR